jgi:hypothetical protein
VGVDVARGWESKAVEAQIEEGEQRIFESARASATNEMRARLQKLESLRLSRSRILQQLERATHPSHRQVLENGLKAIERDIDQVSQELEASQ